jgi:hypothetical protein
MQRLVWKEREREREREEKVGEGVIETKLAVLKVPRQCPLVILIYGKN